MGMFDGYEGVKPSGERGNAPPPNGDYIIQITRIEAPQNLRIGEAYIPHYKIETSTHPDATIGGEYSWFQAFAKQPEAAKAAVLSFLIALAGQKQDTPGAAEVQRHVGAIMRASCSAANPFAGLRLFARTALRHAKDDPAKAYTRTDFHALAGCEGNLEVMLSAARSVGFGAPMPPQYAPPPGYGAAQPQYAPPPPVTPAPSFGPPPPVNAGPPPFVPPPGWPPPPPGYAYGPGGQFVKV